MVTQTLDAINSSQNEKKINMGLIFVKGKIITAGVCLNSVGTKVPH